ncbi:hypothetical protein PFISCL1PPCAC_26009, partial [Pristionchus fissidentatus]
FHYYGDAEFGRAQAALRVHGNSKSRLPYLRTSRAVLRQVEIQLKNGKTVANTYRESVNTGNDVISTARNRRQVTNLKVNLDKARKL